MSTTRGTSRRPRTPNKPSPPPPRWRRDLESVLIPEAQLQSRVRQLARDVERVYRGNDLTIVALLTGTVLFLADLIRHLPMPLRLDFMGVSTYRSGTRPGRLRVHKQVQLDLRDTHVLVIDDILDTGGTLHHVLATLQSHQPRSLRVCVLLDKPERRVHPIPADFVGFTIPNVFVVGYGLDFAERYRNLPFIGVLKPSVYSGFSPNG